jgi:hypothetical protein
MAFTYDNTSVHNLLYVRFREGFALKSVVHPDASTICIQLRLPWMPLISIEYHLRAAWPQTYYQVFVISDIAYVFVFSGRISIEVWLEAPYEFVRDVVSGVGRMSGLRLASMKAFENTLKT